MVKSKLTKYELYEEDNRLYMRLIYQHEDEHRIVETEILKVDTGICIDREPDILSKPYVVLMGCESGMSYHLCKVDTKTSDGITRMIHRVVEEKPIEMTIEEIEKKLGHKIILV